MQVVLKHLIRLLMQLQKSLVCSIRSVDSLDLPVLVFLLFMMNYK